MSITPEQAQATLREADLLHDEAAVDAALTDMAARIEARLGDACPLVLTVMVGGLVIGGKLLPKLNFPLQADYIHATRYRGATSGGELVWLARPQIELKDRVVLIVDDILDEGHTLAGIIDDCRARGAREVYTAVLVNKIHDRRFRNLVADFQALDVPDRYVFGAGMDYKGFLRNAPGIYAAREE